jgi:hypothetical protein
VRLRILAAALLAACLTACAHLPDLTPVGPGETPPPTCRIPIFATAPRRLVHAIEAETPRAPAAVLLGVTVLDPAAGRLQAAMLTLEGLRLFEARDDGALEVLRQLPPFDRPGFAPGLFQDLRLLFFPPPGAPARQGRQADGAWVCRHGRDDGGTLDLVHPAHGGWELRAYDPRGRLTRRVRPCGSAGAEGDACVRLEAFRPAEYVLTLRLIEAEDLDAVE